MNSKKLEPLNFYEILGLDRGSSVYDVQKQYDKMKQIYDIDNPVMKGLFNEKEIYIYRALIENVYEWLIDTEKRKEYDMEIEQFSETLEASFPESFNLKEVLKKYSKNVKNDKKLIKRDIFGREAEYSLENNPHIEHVEVNEIFEKYKDYVITGEILGKLREEIGVTVKYISDNTKISLFVTKALEDDNYSKLPSVVYVKGFLRLYCTVLKLSNENREKVINDYTDVMSGKKKRSSVINDREGIINE